ncbi:MAG TPA: NfeD family protein [Allosphingosinicella sp.]|nr:NfeD family protein [Allosphingosinicella sp.]
MNLDSIDAHWLWLLGAILLALFELAAPGVYLVWFAAAAAATGLLTLAVGLDVAFQFALFSLLSIAAVYGGRRIYDLNPKPTSDPLLNDRMARLRGETLVLAGDIENGRGRVRVGDSVWTCKGPDLSAGTRVRVTGADGQCLIVERAEPAALPAADPA